MSKEKKRLVIVGAGGFGREVQWLIERINELKDEYEILGYVDDNIKQGIMINNYPVLGGMGYLLEQHDEIGVAVAIGSASVRKKIVKACKKNAKLSFPNLIDPSVIMSNHISMGEGNIICAANVLTVNIEIKDFNIINLDCTIGHDVKMESYITVYPSVNISGQVSIGEGVELGTGVQVIQGLKICKQAIIGAGAVIIKDINCPGTYIGVPAKERK